MLHLLRTTSANPDFQNLVIELDKHLAIMNGDTNDFFVQFNKIDLIKNVVVAYNNQLPVGCGAIKEYDAQTIEIKRMFVVPEMRGKGVAVAVLNELENWARELSYTKCILETGTNMLDAIGLYKKMGYENIPNYGQYVGVENSVCFEKTIM